MSNQQNQPSLAKLRLNLFTSFFRIGLFTFGGGYAMLPIMEKEFVETKKWLKPSDILDVFALAQSLPGPVAVNAATFIGNRLAGRPGAVAAMLGCTLPSVLVILIIASGLSEIQDIALVQYFFKGVLAAVTALILMAAWKMARRTVKDWLTLTLTLVTILLVFFLKIHALLTIAGGAICGILLYWLRPAFVKSLLAAEQNKGQTSPAPAQPTEQPAGKGDKK